MVAVVAILIALGTLVVLGYPILRRDQTYAPDRAEAGARVAELRAEKDRLLQAIKDLEFDLAAGKLSPDDYAAMRSKYEARAVIVLRELDAQEALLAQQPAVARRPAPSTASPAPGGLWARPALMTGVVAGLVVIVGTGSFLLGRVTRHEPQGVNAGGGPQGNAPIVASLEAQLQQNPRDINALVGLGRIYLQAGQMPKAIEMYRRALEVDGNNVSALNGMAIILAQAGHSDQALLLFDKALAINPHMPMALLFKGRILYEDKKDYAGAIANWEAFLKIMPQGEPAEMVRGWIEEARKMTGDGPPSRTP
jgi:cytochrome c-type biogenesis protein CcmH/NrfG